MNYTQFSKVAALLAKQYRVKIQDGERWASNIKDKTVFYKKKDIYTLPEDHILGLLLHEIAHLHYTTPTVMPKDNSELTGTIVNMLEDISIEHLISQDYPNAGEILQSTELEVLDTLLRMLPKLTEISEHEKALLYASIKFSGRGYTIDTMAYEKVGTKISEIMKREKELIYNRKKTKEFLPLAKEILKILIDEFKELPPHHKQRLALENKENYEFNPKKTSHRKKVKDNLIEKLKKGKGKGYGTEHVSCQEEQINYVDDIADQAKILGKKLRTILKRNQAMEFGGRYRTGKLPAKRFVRIKTIHDRNPFARRIVKSNQSYAFAIATDISGSMNGTSGKIKPIDAALTALHMSAEALKIANTKRASIIFGCDAITLQPLNKAPLDWDTITDSETFNAANSGGTCIGTAMEQCITALHPATEERKIMILLTDGESNHTTIQTAYDNAKKKNIECVGIIIGPYARSLGTIIGKDNCIVIKDAKNSNAIGQAFIQVLKASIAKSP